MYYSNPRGFKMSSSTKKALDLLVSSLERDSEGSDREWGLLGSALQCSGLWNQKAEDLLLQVRSPAHTDAVVWPLSLLADTIGHCTDDLLSASFQKWTDTLTHNLQDAKELPVVQSVCKCISSLLDRCHSSPRAVTEFSTRQLPAIMTSLLWFTAADPTLQCIVLPLVTKCLVYYPALCAQFRSQLHKWACAGLFSLSHTLSQECSRLMVLTNGYQWSSLLQALIVDLQLALAHLMHQDPKVRSPVSIIDIPPLPSDEPKRSSLLLQEVTVFSRTLCYSLLFPPQPRSNGCPPSVPVDKILGLAVAGLAVTQEQVTGLAYNTLILRSIVPVVHTSLWNLISTLIGACHTHLLPYATPIESSIVQGLTAAGAKCPSLTLAIHRTLSAWLVLKKDVDTNFVIPVTSSLLKQCQSDCVKVRLSALKVLSVLVRTAGPLLPHSLTPTICQLPLEVVSLTTPPNLALALLDLLLACVTSGNPQLSPSVGGAVCMFRNIGTHHHSAKVSEFCRSALMQCELIQHPVALPSHSLHHHGNTFLHSTELTDGVGSLDTHVSTFVPSTNATPDFTRPPPRFPVDNVVRMETVEGQYSSPLVVTTHSPVVRNNEPLRAGPSLQISSGAAGERAKQTVQTHGLDDKDGKTPVINSPQDKPHIAGIKVEEDSRITNPKASKKDNPVKASREDNPVITPRAISCSSSDDSDTENALHLFVAASPDTSDLDVV